MRPNEGSRPATRTARERLDRAREALRTAPTPVKVLLVTAVLVLVVFVPFLRVRLADLIVVIPLLYGPYAVWRGQRSLLASVGVGLWGVAVITVVAAKLQHGGAHFVPFLLLPVAAVAAAHAPAIARQFVPCRTVAWVLAWSVPPGMIAWWAAPQTPAVGYLVAWVLAASVLAWRLPCHALASRERGRDRGRRAHGARRRGSPRPGGRPRPARQPGGHRGSARDHR